MTLGEVGLEFMGGWFKQMAWAMKPENSFKVFTMTTVPDSRWEQYSGYVSSSSYVVFIHIQQRG
jgi:cyclopropane-fatty-acyl-phospholipid synthase